MLFVYFVKFGLMPPKHLRTNTNYFCDGVLTHVPNTIWLQKPNKTYLFLLFVRSIRIQANAKSVSIRNNVWYNIWKNNCLFGEVQCTLYLITQQHTQQTYKFQYESADSNTIVYLHCNKSIVDMSSNVLTREQTHIHTYIHKRMM